MSNEPDITQAGGIAPQYAFPINLGELVAVSLFQSSDETREQLARAKFELTKRGDGHLEVNIIATNGRILCVYNREVTPDDIFTQMPESDFFAVDLSGCKKLPKAKTPDAVRVEVYPAHVDFSSGSLKYTAKRDPKLDSGFPNWRGIIPTDAPQVQATFAINSEYVARCGKAVKLVADTTQILVQSFGKERPVLVTCAENRGFIGLVMPCKVEEWPEAPDWLKDAIENKPAAKDLEGTK